MSLILCLQNRNRTYTQFIPVKSQVCPNHNNFDFQRYNKLKRLDHLGICVATHTTDHVEAPNIENNKS